MIVACVRTGNLYGPEYVYRLKRGVEKHLPRPHKFVCITDNDGDTDGVEMLFTKGLPGWWAKMRIFGLAFNERVLYFDLDTVIVGDLSPLADLGVPFGICANFTRRAMGNSTEYPCRFGSCLMTLAPGFGGDIWEAFQSRRHELILNRYGDQKVIEELCAELKHEPALLQDLLPPGYFVGYRDLPRHPKKPPEGAAVVVFAGRNKPHNTECQWARDAWAA